MTDTVKQLREWVRAECICGRCSACRDGANEIERLETFIEFVFRWVMDAKMADTEIVSIVKHHPRMQDMLAARSIPAGKQ